MKFCSSALIIFIGIGLLSCETTKSKTEKFDIAVGFLGIKDISNYHVKEDGNAVIVKDKISDERFICTISDSLYVKTYKYFSSRDDSFAMSFYNDSTLVNDYDLNVQRTNPSVSNWPTDSVIEFFFPKIPFGHQTLLLNYKNGKGKSLTIDSVKIINGKCSLKIPFNDLEEYGFGLAFKYCKYVTIREWVF